VKLLLLCCSCVVVTLIYNIMVYLICTTSVVAVWWLSVGLVGAGEAELSITVIDPSGHMIGFDLEPTPEGQRVTYIPECPGTYKVNATYCGITVPGNYNITDCSNFVRNV